MASKTTTSNIGNTVSYFMGGTDGVTGEGSTINVTFGGTWVSGEEFSLILTDTLSGLQTLVGAGNVTEYVPTFLITYNNKIYAMGGSSTASNFIPGTVFFTAINSPTVWNDPNASGNGFVVMSNWYGTPEPIVAAAPYQGLMAFFARRTIQLWSVDANPDNWAIQQTLENIGTLAPLSVQSLGTGLDVVFLDDTGFRSLRQEVITLAAIINDIGSPIDIIIQNSLLSGTATSNAASIGVVEPLSKRYWGLLNGVIYVLSYYPANKILAWTTYTPTDSNGNAMTVTSMVVYNGQVWLNGTDPSGNNVSWQYGGSNNNTYDTTKAKWQTGFFDAKTPGTLKQMSAVDIAVNASQGGIALSNPDTWQCFVSADEKSAGNPVNSGGASALFTLVYKGKTSSFDTGTQPYSDQGSHFSIYCESQGDGNSGAGGPATFSMFVLHEQPENENN